MSIDLASGLAALVLAFIVLGVLGFGLVLVRDGKLAWGAVILLGMTGILIWVMAVLYH
jgi:hypothetical protein